MASFRGPRIAVLGGAGYIGYAVTRQLLSEGHEVLAVDSLIHGPQDLEALRAYPGFSFIEGDLRDLTLMNKIARESEAIVLLAALVGEPACARDPDETVAVNYLAPLAILESALYHGRVSRFLFASTDSCYGQRPGEKLDEEAPLRPLSLYASLKASFEKELLLRARGRFLSPTVLRLATVFGLSQRTRFDLAVNLLAREATLREKAKIFSGEQWRPLVHARDAALAFALALDAPLKKVRGEIFNVGADAQNVQFKALGEIIQKAVPRSRIEFVPGAPDLRDYFVSFQKIREVLGFKPQVSIPEGIAEIREALLKGLIPDPYSPFLTNCHG
ncbi:MAG: NAD(P)-dependent oxidoreductase [Deltaproteobacteria bacterium]|jgi:nucleoside-diphosphate-sugar epimerase|nr:NAD(P)-dependent oxidoreductase [Deltaproteobacteria bacterium]